MCILLCRYFKWVGEIQKFLQYWRKKFQEQDVDYGIVDLYDSILLPLGDSVCASSLLVDMKNVKMTFLSKVNSLKNDLLLSIPGQPEWCTLPGLLEEYGVYLPQEAKDLIAEKISFPSQEDQGTEGTLSCRDISLRVHKNMSMKELTSLVKKVNSFQEDFFEFRNTFVFFKLNRSILFHKYLWHYLEKVAKSEEDQEASIPFPGFSSRISGMRFSPSSGSMVQGRPMQHLLSALQSTLKLMERLMSGTATYSEITAEGNLMSYLLDTTRTIDAQRELISQQIDLRREFEILSRYGKEFKPFLRIDFSGMQSMLELAQYSKHVDDIQFVFDQYHLTSCSEDPLLKELIDIVKDVKSGNTSSLTPTVAKQQMARVKEILNCGESSKWLYIFAAVRESAAFYKFVKEKKFDGSEGQAVFVQQYQLITAQLQHEEYDDQVLNHLRAAFKVISPFTDSSKTFSSLVKEVAALNPVDSLNHLQTVNANIVIVRLWFSKSEVRIF
jgi:hypothetical protein